jgi:hypothetical protein
MSTAEQMVITTNSSIFELAPAALTVLVEAGATGLDSRSRFPNSVSEAVRKRFHVAPSAPHQWGARHNISQPDFNIELAVSSLVRMKCIQKDDHMRFITAEGRELLKMPPSIIRDAVKAVHNAVKAINNSKEDNERKLENERELENELRAIKDALMTEDSENPDDDDDDARARRLTERVIRIGAFPFRSALIEAYRGKCAITESGVIQILQAAHIKPYRGAATNRINNGLLLRVDLHQLFDKDLIGVNPDTLRICISKELIGTEYEKFSDRKLAEPVGQVLSKRSLKARWDKFRKAQTPTSLP